MLFFKFFFVSEPVPSGACPELCRRIEGVFVAI
jgi:hypothetical protein